MIGTGEIILIVTAILLIFGGSQIPKVARSIGEGIRELKKAMREPVEEDKKQADPTPGENRTGNTD